MVKWDNEIAAAQEYYHKTAKSADQKMRRLERDVKKTGNTDILRYAYARAKRDIKQDIGGSERFDIKIKQRKGERDIDYYWRLKDATADAERFLNADTSSITEYEMLNKQRHAKFNESLKGSLDRPLTFTEFSQVMETGFFDLASSILGGYRTAVRVMNAVLNNRRILKRKSDFTAQAVMKILDKYKFKNDPELYPIVQSALKREGFKR